MVWLNRLAGPLVCRRYAIAVKCFTPKYSQTTVKSLFTNCGLFFVKI